MNTPKSEIIPLFSVPMGVTCNENHNAIKSDLIQLFKEKEEKSQKSQHGLVTKNSKVFESSFDLFDWQNSSINELRKYCWGQLYQLIGTLNQYDVAMLQKLHIASESWYHVTRKGGYFGIHNHAMSAWSGVYCVQAGDTVEEYPDSGCLNIVSPHIGTTGYIDKSCSSLKGQFGRGNRLINLEEGQLVIFPSWLLHEVKPYFGEKERITVAFNAWFKMAT